MKVTKDSVVSLVYQISTEEGVLIEESPLSRPLHYLYGSGCLMAGLENALEGRKAGDRFDVNVSADEGYGNYDEDLVQHVPKEIFMQAGVLEPGMRFLVDTDSGQIPVKIIEVKNEYVIIDANPDFAGQNLHCSVEVLAIRAATPEERIHGHVHDEHCAHYENGYDRVTGSDQYLYAQDDNQSVSCGNSSCGCH